MRPTRAEIHVSHFLHNLRYVRERVGDATKIMAIVKANAYGHGIDIIARAALESGFVHSFGVATEEEGCKLRKFTSQPILVLTTALEEEIDIFLAHDLDFTVSDIAFIDRIAERAAALGTQARVHLKVDTGMRRVGVEPAEALNALERIASHGASITLVAISTHFATSDELESPFFNKQLETFRGVLSTARHAGHEIPCAHAANSGAILQRPRESAFDMVRPGIMLYGYTPSFELNDTYGRELSPPLELISHATLRRRIPPGEGVSYNLRWRADRETSIITIPVGYGDGYPRALTNRTSVLISGKAYPVVGTICMDQMMVNIGDDNVEVGDRVVLISPSPDLLNAWTLAQSLETIPYEILTSIAARVPRIEVA